LIGARLRLLRQQGPGLGSMFDAALPGKSEQATLEAELVGGCWPPSAVASLPWKQNWIA